MNRTIMRVTTSAIVAGIMWPAAAIGLASAAIATGPARTEAAGSSDAQVASVSCPSAGNCAAVGYLNASGVTVFVLNEVHGTWGRAQPVKGMAALPKGGPTQAYFDWVSCSSPGNCGAGGNYFDHSYAWHPFVVTQTNGTWGRAKEITLPNPHTGAYAQVEFVSCQAAGDCTAVGSYTSKNSSPPFVATERNGNWGAAEELPGMRSVNAEDGDFRALSCVSIGNCGAGGTYIDGHGTDQAFAVTETNGHWGNMQEVPGTAAVNKGGRAATESMSCPAAGSCLAVGFYEDAGDNTHPFISSQKNGVWGHIQPVPGLAKLGSDLFDPDLQWGWCASAGNCTAVGSYGAGDSDHSFDVTEKNGRWGDARKIRLGARSVIAITSVACASIGNCSAGGYFGGPGSTEVFVISETNGTWGKSEEVPGSVALNHGGSADLNSIACGAAGDCVGGGYYSPKWPFEEPFLVTQANGAWGHATKVPGLP